MNIGVDGIAGRYFEAGSSRYGDARLTHIDGVVSISVENDSRVITWGASICDVFIPVAGLPRRVEFPDGAAFEVGDTPEVEAFFSAMGASKGPRVGFRSHPKLMTLIVIAAIAAPFLVWFGFTATTDIIARALPDSVAQQVGAVALGTFEDRLFKPSTLPESKRIEARAVFDDLVQVAGVDPNAVNLKFRTSKFIGPNGIAFPDGTIVITDALIKLSKHPDEIAAVLAHELAHVEERHSLRLLVRSVGIVFLVEFLLGDSISLLEEAASLGTGILSLSFNREFELEADRRAGELMRVTGRDPSKLIDLLRRIVKDCGSGCEKSSLFSTHPGFEDRLDAVAR